MKILKARVSNFVFAHYYGVSLTLVLVLFLATIASLSVYIFTGSKTAIVIGSVLSLGVVSGPVVWPKFMNWLLPNDEKGGIVDDI